MLAPTFAHSIPLERVAITVLTVQELDTRERHSACLVQHASPLPLERVLVRQDMASRTHIQSRKQARTATREFSLGRRRALGASALAHARYCTTRGSSRVQTSRGAGDIRCQLIAEAAQGREGVHVEQVAHALGALLRLLRVRIPFQLEHDGLGYVDHTILLEARLQEG